MPNRSSTHDHVPRSRAYPTYPGTHLIRAIDNHALGRQLFDNRRIQFASLIVKLEIKWRLVIDNDVENIRPLQFLVSLGHERQSQYGN